MTKLVFTVPGVATKGSWRAIRTARGIVFKNDNPATRAWTTDCQWMARRAMTRAKLTPLVAIGDVRTDATFYLRAVARADLDKLFRALLDALTGIVYRDDRQVRYGSIGKEEVDAVESTTVAITFDETDVGPAKVDQPTRRPHARHGQTVARAR